MGKFQPPFNEVLCDLDGDPIKDEKGREMTLGKLSMRAIDAGDGGQSKPSTEDKLADWDLMVRIRDGGEVERSEYKRILGRVSQHFGPGIVGPATALLKPYTEARRPDEDSAEAQA